MAIVTGGGRGIGAAISRVLGAQGAFVIVNYRSGAEAAEKTVAAIVEAGGEAQAVGFDVADAEATDTAIRSIAKERGGVHILVNNAGIALDQLLMRVKPEEIERTFATNVAGAIHCAKAAIRPMMRAKTGRIVQVSSVVAESGNPGQAVYSASKAALLGLTKTLAREYASRGVTVNAVAPGFIATDMTAELPEAAQASIIEQTPLGRVGTAEEVASAVLYLVSDEAAFVTGQTLRVNGGMYV
ncbi:MAG: 3-oxoacyl-ACP reductase family protein [Myxococcota bacterium]